MVGRKNEARQDSYEERRHDKASRGYATRRYCADELAFAWSLERGADLLRDHWVRRWTEVSSACHPGSYCIQRGTSRANAAECGHGTLESRAATGRDVAGNWWEVFHEPELNTLEDQLNINNENIKVYFEDYMEARAIVREARAQYFPTASTAPSYSRSQSSSNLTNSTQANPGKLSSLYSLPVTVSWEPDLWGKIRNEVHAAEYNAQVSAADLENERLSEQIALADYFFEIRGQDL